MHYQDTTLTSLKYDSQCCVTDIPKFNADVCDHLGLFSYSDRLFYQVLACDNDCVCFSCSPLPHPPQEWVTAKRVYSNHSATDQSAPLLRLMHGVNPLVMHPV